MKPVWVLWWSCLALCGHCGPGVVMRVTQKWMDYILTEGIEVFRYKIQHDRLPNILGSTRVFGMVEYAITGISVLEFDTSDIVVIPTPPKSILLNVKGAMAKVFGQWNVKHWLINDNGNFSLRVSGVTMKVQFTTLEDSAARPSVILSSCQSEVKNAKVHLSGGASWLYNLFTGFLERPIRENLNKRLCPGVGEVIQILQKELATFQVIADLDAYNKIDYSLINPPRVEMTHIDLDLKGAVYHPESRDQQEDNITPIILPDTRQSMILLGLSEYFFNNLGKTYFIRNVLKMTITPEQYPEEWGVQTSDYAQIIPKIKKYYTESKFVRLIFQASKPPMINLTSQLTMKLEGILEAMALRKDMSPETFFATDVVATFIADMMRLSNFTLYLSFTLQSFHFQNFRSHVGEASIPELERSLGHMLKEHVVQEINRGLSGGIPMPSLANVTLKEPAITVNPGCLVMAVDMVYTPWKELVANLPDHGP
ncbi:bactericidal permeability-increasing protein-like [Engystomops pustulosus]|uniref:bactericidal permeability-increasing protein-like n=1 Tax=Engystomops pustulosus TaxID=76066 RepID=UPI003AFB0985